MEEMLRRLRSRHSRNTVCLPNELLDSLPAREKEEEEEERVDCNPSTLLRWSRRKWGFLLDKVDLEIASRYLQNERIADIADSAGESAQMVAMKIAFASVLLIQYRKASPPVRVRRVANFLEQFGRCIASGRSCGKCEVRNSSSDTLRDDLLRFASARFIIPPRDAEHIKQWFAAVRSGGCIALTDEQRLRLGNALLRTASAAKGREGFRNAFLANPARVRRLLDVDMREVEGLAAMLMG